MWKYFSINSHLFSWKASQGMQMSVNLSVCHSVCPPWQQHHHSTPQPTWLLTTNRTTQLCIYMKNTWIYIKTLGLWQDNYRDYHKRHLDCHKRHLDLNTRHFDWHKPHLDLHKGHFDWHNGHRDNCRQIMVVETQVRRHRLDYTMGHNKISISQGFSKEMLILLCPRLYILTVQFLQPKFFIINYEILM